MRPPKLPAFRRSAKILGGIAVLAAVATPAFAAPQATIDFDGPEYTPGNVNGQQGWFALGNSPSSGEVVANPDGGQMLTVVHLPAYAGVANGLNSPLVDGAGESTGLNDALDAQGRNHFVATTRYLTPPAAVIGGTFIEINPSFRNPDDQTASRYARAALTTFPDDVTGMPSLFSSWPGANNTFPLAPAIPLEWGTWYELEYDLRIADGLAADGGPNDTFCITVRDDDGVQLGVIPAYSWEVGYSSGAFGGGTGPRLVNGIDILTRNTLSTPERGSLDELTITTATLPAGIPKPMNVQATVDGTTATVSFDAPNVDNCTPIESYTITNDQNSDTIVLDANATSAEFGELEPGTTYTFTVSVLYRNGATATSNANPVQVPPTTTTTTAPTTITPTTTPATTTPGTTMPGAVTTAPGSNTTVGATPIGQLPSVGSDTDLIAILAATAVAAGLGCVLVARRRPPSRRHS